MTPTSLRQFIPDLSLIPKTNTNSDVKDPCLIYDDELESFQVPQPERIWKRMRGGFGIPPQNINNPLIASRLQWQAKHPKHFTEVTRRSKTYLHFILDNLDEYNMPYEIALIPIIESGFNPFARSPSGILGLWQFTAQTGKNVGLQQNAWYDGRRDVQDSTRAALKYLNRLHGMFNDDWLLAIAAYNCGEGTVQKAIKNNQRQGKATDFWSLNLPMHTKTYIPRILALKEIFLNPDKYNVKLPDVANVPQFMTVDVGSQIDFNHVATLSQTSIGEITQLNPGYSRKITPPQGPHVITIPATHYHIFATALATAPLDKRITWDTYTIKNGDTLASIAQKFHSSPIQLNKLNNTQSLNLQVGNTLQVPRIMPAHIETTTNSKANANQTTRYKVVNGDSLWSISKKFKVSIQQLTTWNQLKINAPLKLGRQLIIQKPH